LRAEVAEAKARAAATPDEHDRHLEEGSTLHGWSAKTPEKLKSNAGYEENDERRNRVARARYHGCPASAPALRPRLHAGASGHDVVMPGSDSEIERLAREVAQAHGARWLSIIFAPENAETPWSVSIDEGRGADATTAHGATLIEALGMRLSK
jgi:hypothetical protein